MFLFRLYNFKLNPQLRGYANDIYAVLSLYGLVTYMDNYLNPLFVFPSKSEWKRIVNSAIWTHVRLTWSQRISTVDFSRFRQLHNCYEISEVWLFSSQYPRILAQCKSVIKCIAYTARNREICPRCHQHYVTCFADHILYECKDNGPVRNRFLVAVAGAFGVYARQCIEAMDKHVYVNTLLGNRCPLLVNIIKDRYDVFMQMAFRHVHRVWLTYCRCV